MTDVLQKLAGRFVYRFGGYAQQTDSYYLEGIGFLDLQKDGKLTGNHRYSMLRLKGQDKLLTGEYSLAGTLAMDGYGKGSANIKFTVTSGGTDNADSNFHVILGADLDHLWFISAGGTRPGGAPTRELTRLEAIRMKPIAA